MKFIRDNEKQIKGVFVCKSAGIAVAVVVVIVVEDRGIWLDAALVS